MPAWLKQILIHANATETNLIDASMTELELPYLQLVGGEFALAVEHPVDAGQRESLQSKEKKIQGLVKG